jgi:hypothetical protein
MIELQNHNELWSNHNFPSPVNASEDILLILRKDVSVVISKIQKYFIIFIIAFVVRTAVSNAFDNSLWIYFFDTFLYGSFAVILTMGAYFLHNYYLSYIAITTQRLIFLEQKSLVFCHIDTLSYMQIEEIKVELNRAREVLNLKGKLILKIKGDPDKEEIILDNIPNPEQIKELIEELKSKV